MKIVEQYMLVLLRDTISLQTRGFFKSNLGRVRIVLPDQPVLPDWELFLAKLTLLWKDDQFSDHKLCQFGRFAFHLLAGRSDRPQFWQKLQVLICDDEDNKKLQFLENETFAPILSSHV